MKNSLIASLRVAAFVATLSVLPAAFAENSDAASRQLAAAGLVSVNAVGPYVNVGTCRVQVSAKLGHPTSTLSDGTWLYDGFAAKESQAKGTLVVRFANGRVRSLSLASPAVVTALRSKPATLDQKALVAAWNQQ
jgi:hypothetical protein